VLEPLMKTRKSQRGFTLVELMTVVLVASVLLAIAAPSFRGMLDRRRIEGRANELLTDLQYARSEAVARNRNVELRIGGAGNATCYVIAVPAGGVCDCTTPPPSCTAPSIGLKTVTMANDIGIAAAVPFVFEPVRGAMASDAAASATVAHSVRTYTVQVERNGRVAPLTY
jgi:type IV fimbrial biogenesis protein FimT